MKRFFVCLFYSFCHKCPRTRCPQDEVFRKKFGEMKKKS